MVASTVWTVGITVGFDLDMTLIDARPGMAAAMNALGAESGLPLDGDAFAANLGPPLDDILRGFEAPEERIPGLVDLQPERVDVQLRVGPVLAGDDERAAAGPVHRAQ